MTFDLNVDLLGTPSTQVLSRDRNDTPAPTAEEFAAWLRHKGYADLVDMLGFGEQTRRCGAHKYGDHCTLEAAHEGKHSWAKGRGVQAA